MKLALKNVQENRAMSEETPCFSASLYVDGKRVGVVLNHGHGGSNLYHVPRALEDELCAAAYVATGEDFEPLDRVIFDLLYVHGIRKDAKRTKAPFPVVARKGKDQFGWLKEYLVGFSCREAYEAHDLSEYDETVPVEDIATTVTL